MHPVICNHCPTPTYADWRRIAGQWPNEFPRSAGLVILHKCSPVEFNIIQSRALTLSRSLQCRAFSRVVMDEKSLSPLFPVSGRAVVTNDWHIRTAAKTTSTQRNISFIEQYSCFIIEQQVLFVNKYLQTSKYLKSSRVYSESNNYNISWMMIILWNISLIEHFNTPRL